MMLHSVIPDYVSPWWYGWWPSYSTVQPLIYKQVPKGTYRFQTSTWRYELVWTIIAGIFWSAAEYTTKPLAESKTPLTFITREVLRSTLVHCHIWMPYGCIWLTRLLHRCSAFLSSYCSVGSVLRTSVTSSTTYPSPFVPLSSSFPILKLPTRWLEGMARQLILRLQVSSSSVKKMFSPWFATWEEVSTGFQPQCCHSNDSQCSSV